MSRVALGDFEITLVRAGFYWWDGGAIFGVVPRTLWSKKFAPDELNRIRLGFNCYVIRTGKHSILIETGAGDKLDSRARTRMKLPDQELPLPEILAAQGIDPGSIDIVINSHLHFDHCGGNTALSNGTAKPAFPEPAITHGAVSGNTHTSGTSATASAISMRITIRWWSRDAWNYSTSIVKSYPECR